MRSVVVFLLSVIVLLGSPRAAFAQRDGSIHIFSFSSKNKEKHADALTQALRMEVRGTPGWTVVDPPSFSLMMLGQKCTQTPDAVCLSKIGEHMKVQRFVWGTVDGARGSVKVTAHLWESGKSDTAVDLPLGDAANTATHPEVKEAAHTIARRLLFREGTLVLNLSVAAGQIFVDGLEKTRFDGKAAQVSLPEGLHDVQVRTANAPPLQRKLRIQAGETTTEVFNFALPESSKALDESSSSRDGGRNKSRTTVATALIIAGGAGLLIGGGTSIYWAVFRGDTRDRAQKYFDAKQMGNDYCNESTKQALEICSDDKKTKTLSGIAIAATSIGAAAAIAGIVLIVTDPKTGTTEERPVAVTPLLGKDVAGATFSLRF